MRDVQNSPYQRKILIDSHWLELELTELADYFRRYKTLPSKIIPESWAVLFFVGMVVEIEKRISAHGRVQLLGRLRDGLKSGFAGLYLELEIARLLMEDGYEVALPDLEGFESYDLHFWKDGFEGELECKSVSANAGRKIHREDFSRFVQSVETQLQQYASKKKRGILIVTLNDRMPSDVQRQNELKVQSIKLLKEETSNTLSGTYFKLEKVSYESYFSDVALSDQVTWYKKCKSIFGQNCHVGGISNKNGLCLIVMRSNQQDDTSKPTRDALKKAASQLTGKNTGYIAVQHEDIEPANLVFPSFRRTETILDYSIFLKKEFGYISGIYHCAYRGVYVGPHGIVKPAFISLNPTRSIPKDAPFQSSISNSEFARLLEVDPKTVDPDDHLYGLG